MIMTTMSLSVCLLSALPADRPAELMLALQNRAQLFSGTALIEWVVERDGKKQFYTSEYAGSEFLLTERGDEQGLHDGRAPGEPFAYSDTRTLFDDAGNQWKYREGNLWGQVHDNTCERFVPQFDIRMLDLAAAPVGDDRPEGLSVMTFLDVALRDEDLAEYTVQDRGDGLVDVLADWPTSSEHVRMTWRLDPNKDWSPVMVEQSQFDGATYMRAEITHRVWDGHWFIDTVRYSRQPATSRVDRPWSVRVVSASFDKPWHRAHFPVAETLHMLPGTNLSRYDAVGLQAGTIYIFDGEKPVTTDEMANRIKVGTLDMRPFQEAARRYDTDPPGRYPARLDAKGYYADPNLAHDPKLWEPYVRSFIQLHHLGGDRARRAWDILGRCQQSVYPFVREHQDEMKTLDKNLEDVRSRLESFNLRQGEAQRQALKKKLADLKKQELHLYGPIDEMFTDTLIPRLEHLLSASEQIPTTHTPAPQAPTP